jgi:hypothetical protein
MLKQHNVYKEQEEMDQLYKWTLDTKYEDFPAELVSYVKILMLDVLGCIIGGSKEEAIPEIVNFVQEHGGAKESYLPIYGVNIQLQWSDLLWEAWPGHWILAMCICKEAIPPNMFFLHYLRLRD